MTTIYERREKVILRNYISFFANKVSSLLELLDSLSWTVFIAENTMCNE